MADGNTHLKFNTYTLAAITGIAPVLVVAEVITIETAALLIAGGIAGVFFTPDDDQEGTTVPKALFGQVLTFWIPNKNIKKLVCDFLIMLRKLLTMPYALWFEHRIFWTHFPLLGVPIKLIYLSLIFGFVVGHEELVVILVDNPTQTLFFLLAWIVQDFTHWWLDEFPLQGVKF